MMRKRTVAFITRDGAELFIDRMRYARRQTEGPSVQGMNYVVTVWYKDGEQDQLPLGIQDGPA